MHNNVKRCKYNVNDILIAVAIEAAMLEDSMTSHKNALWFPRYLGAGSMKNVCYTKLKLQAKDLLIHLILFNNNNTIQHVPIIQ